MVCNKCGKEINYDSTVCVECALAAKQESADAENQYKNRDTDFNTGDFKSNERTESENARGNTCNNYDREVYTPAYTVLEQTQTSPQPPRNRVMVGFGKGLAASIISVFAIIFAAIALGTSAYNFESGAVLLFVFAIPATVMSIVFGAMGIGVFKRRHIENTLPIPALALGIEGVVVGCISALYCFITLFVVMLG